ncbi:MAG: hypothetical protein QXL94_05905 [Candidatus Parvarchaeum sp.]
MSEDLEDFLKSVTFHRFVLKEVREVLMSRLRDEFGGDSVSYEYSHDRKVIRVHGSMSVEEIRNALLKGDGRHVVVEW